MVGGAAAVGGVVVVGGTAVVGGVAAVERACVAGGTEVGYSVVWN